MKLREVLAIIEEEELSRDVDLDREVETGQGTDLISDTLAISHINTSSIIELTNP